jgi:hypothetical protein
VPIRCGSTRESVCAACARKARIGRMQQCVEGWHITDEPERTRPRRSTTRTTTRPHPSGSDQPGGGRTCPTSRAWSSIRARLARCSSALGPRVPAFAVTHPHTAFLRAPCTPTGHHETRALQLPASRPGRAPLLQPVRKTVAHHKADRTEVVRETLLSAGIDAPDLDRMAASVACPMVRRGSSGQTCGRTTTPTSRSFSTRSASANTGASSTSTPRRRDAEPLAPPDAWTVLKKKSEVPCARTAACR